MLLMRSMAPAVVAVDEVGGEEDLRALHQVLQSGSSVVATMHGDSMEDVQNHTKYAGILFQRYLFLEKQKGICQIRDMFDQNHKRMQDIRGTKKCSA